MNPGEMIEEWKKGCSCSSDGKPEECLECTRSLVDALDKYYQEQSDLYQLPATRFVSNSPWRQWWHLLSEVLEIGRALLTGDLQHAAAETWDVKQSSETLHRILSGRGADVSMAKETIVDNNTERGYYKDEG